MCIKDVLAHCELCLLFILSGRPQKERTVQNDEQGRIHDWLSRGRLGRGSSELGRGSNDLDRGSNDLGRGSIDLGRGMLKYKLS